MSRHPRAQEEVPRGVEFDTELTAEDLKELVKRYKALIKERTGKLPQDPWKQLLGRSAPYSAPGMNDRAIVYRRKYNIPARMGHRRQRAGHGLRQHRRNSATGVAFTRDPATGENVFYGEYLINAQGEDVVAGVRTPEPDRSSRRNARSPTRSSTSSARSWRSTSRTCRTSSSPWRTAPLHAPDPQRQAHRPRRRPHRHRHGQGKAHRLEDRHRRIPAESIASLLVPIFDAEAARRRRSSPPASPPAPAPPPARSSSAPTKPSPLTDKGERSALPRGNLPEDLRGMLASEGILTSRGGVSSHAALVARQMGKVCVCGAADIVIDYKRQNPHRRSAVLKEGDDISIDGTRRGLCRRRPTAPPRSTRSLVGKLKPKERHLPDLRPS
jgi:pyruvate, orthophosphate dikinase